MLIRLNTILRGLSNRDNISDLEASGISSAAGNLCKSHTSENITRINMLIAFASRRVCQQQLIPVEL